MKVRSVNSWVASAIATVVLGAAVLGWAQTRQSGNSPLGNKPETRLEGNEDGTIGPDPNWVAQRMRALNADRHKSLVTDTDKLLKLARQLDAEIASNPTPELTAEELRKVGEIEKLARDVKAKMAQSFAGGPQLRLSPIPVGGPR